MGGRGFKRINTFSPWDSNTIDDITGFKRKMSDMRRRWEGWYTDQGWAPRQPQDFPVVPQKQLVYNEVRSEQVNPDETAQPPITPI